MTKDERTEPTAAAAAAAADASSPADPDTEGHSMGLLLGFNALSSAGHADQRARSKKPANEELPPLSKTWPSMKDDKKA